MTAVLSPNSAIPLGAKTARDMSSTDWDELRDLLLKWLDEEKAEPEHDAVDDYADGIREKLKKYSDGLKGATDSALRIALDKDSVRTFDKDGRLHVSISNITKANICPYRGDEIPDCEALGLDPEKIYQLYRHPEELEKAVPTLNGLPLLRKHIPVSADDHQPYDVVGSMGTEAVWADPYVRNSLTIWAADDIEDVRSGKKKELSSGYHYVPVMTPGEADGVPYDGIMTEIVFNHVALVEEGRAGPDVVVGDSFEEMQWAILGRELERFIKAA